MYNVILNVIKSRNYELADMLIKIDTLWVQGSITEEERAELVSLARQNAEIQQSINVLSKMEELDKRVRALEAAGKEEVEDGEEEPEGVTYPDYVAGTWYYNDDVVMFDGKAYRCITPEGQTCVWSPVKYPAFWEAV